MPQRRATLQFHARTFEMVGATPKPTGAAVKLLLVKRERECGLTFPASVREWFLFDGPGLDHRIGCGPTGDTMVPLRGLGRPFSDWYNERHPVLAPQAAARRPRGRARLTRQTSDRTKPPRLNDFVRAGLLVVMHENQGVCTWAVRLDGSDDPPVVVEVDSRHTASSPSEVRWERCAESFSTFMHCRAWDHGHSLASIAVRAGAQDRSLARSDLKLLQSHFSEGPRTFGHPGVTNYRFFTPNSAILIWDGEDDEWRGGQADWVLMATSKDALLELLRRVWHCGTLRETLYASDPRSKEVVDQARARD